MQDVAIELSNAEQAYLAATLLDDEAALEGGEDLNDSIESGLMDKVTRELSARSFRSKDGIEIGRVESIDMILDPESEKRENTYFVEINGKGIRFHVSFSAYDDDECNGCVYGVSVFPAYQMEDRIRNVKLELVKTVLKAITGRFGNEEGKMLLAEGFAQMSSSKSLEI